MSAHLSWLEAGVVGAMQGVAELFPISSLGHSVLIPAWVGGSWQRDLNVSNPESPYLAFIVGLHVATAIALLIYFWRDWVRIIGGLVTSIGAPRGAHRRPAARLAARPRHDPGRPRRPGRRALLPHPPRQARAHRDLPDRQRSHPAGHERLRRRDANVDSDYVDERVSGPESDQRLAAQPVGQAVFIGALQIAALAPGISRSGIAMAGGMLRGLSREDAARFSFLLATPVILAAGALKLGDLSGPLGDGIRAQVLFGSILSGVGAYLSVRFLTRYLPTGPCARSASTACSPASRASLYSPPR